MVAEELRMLNARNERVRYGSADYFGAAGQGWRKHSGGEMLRKKFYEKRSPRSA